MERKLQQLIRDVSVISDIKNRDPINPLIVHLENDGVSYPVLCALKEPIGMLFPFNGIWVVMDPTSKYYNQALKLKAATVQAQYVTDGGFTFGWEVITRLADLFGEAPIYSTDAVDGPVGPTGPVGTYDVNAVIVESLQRVNDIIHQSNQPN